VYEPLPEYDEPLAELPLEPPVPDVTTQPPPAASDCASDVLEPHLLFWETPVDPETEEFPVRLDVEWL
jgi:hypothetical protein